MANPEVELWSGGGGRYLAHEADGAERERLWGRPPPPSTPGFADYQRRAGARTIPVVVCEPMAQS